MFFKKQNKEHTHCAPESSAAVSLLEREKAHEGECEMWLSASARFNSIHVQAAPGLWSTRRLFDDHEQQAASLPLSSPLPSLPPPSLIPLLPFLPSSLPLSLYLSQLLSLPPFVPQALTSEVGVPLYQKLLREIHGNHHLESNPPTTTTTSTIHPSIHPPSPPLNENNHCLLIIDSRKQRFVFALWVTRLRGREGRL